MLRAFLFFLALSPIAHAAPMPEAEQRAVDLIAAIAEGSVTMGEFVQRLPLPPTRREEVQNYFRSRENGELWNRRMIDLVPTPQGFAFRQPGYSDVEFGFTAAPRAQLRFEKRVIELDARSFPEIVKDIDAALQEDVTLFSLAVPRAYALAAGLGASGAAAGQAAGNVAKGSLSDLDQVKQWKATRAITDFTCQNFDDGGKDSARYGRRVYVDAGQRGVVIFEQVPAKDEKSASFKITTKTSSIDGAPCIYSGESMDAPFVSRVGKNTQCLRPQPKPLSESSPQMMAKAPGASSVPSVPAGRAGKLARPPAKPEVKKVEMESAVRLGEAARFLDPKVFDRCCQPNNECRKLSGVHPQEKTQAPLRDGPATRGGPVTQ